MAAHEVFACKTCPKVFHTRGRFKQHLRTHSKPWKCELCPKGFGLRADLKRHIDSRHRTGHQTFRCEVCGRRYARKDNLTQHTRKEHERESRCVSRPKKLLQTRIPADDALDQPPDWLLLTSSASNGNLGTIELLIDSGIDLDLRADDGSSAMHCAARTGQIAVLQFLIARGADINAENRRCTLPLYEAIIGGHLDCIILLLQAGTNMISFLFRKGVQRNFADYIARAGNCEHMMAFLANVPKEVYYDHIVLRLAAASAKFGQVAMLQQLHEIGGNALKELNHISSQPKPLNAAVLYGQLAAVTFLLPLYGDRESLFLLLRLAAGKGWAHICDALLAYQSDTKLDAALYAASRNGRPAVIKILLDHQRATTRQRELPLREPMLAALWNDHLGSLRQLVSYDAGVPPQDDENSDGLSRVALAEYLLNNGLHVNGTSQSYFLRWDKRGTLLHLAAEHNDSDLARFILKHKDFDKENIDKAAHWRTRYPQPGETALDMAQSLGHTEIASLLLAHGATNRNIAPAVQSQEGQKSAQTPLSTSDSDLEMQEASNSDSDSDLEDDEEFDHFTNETS